jgi:23S rRNA (adenine1618-N6)-methyltransferase
MGEKRKASQDLRGYTLPVNNGDANQPTAMDSTLTSPAKDDVARDRHYAELYTKAPAFQQLALQDANFARL